MSNQSQPTQDSATLAEGQQVITACAMIHHTFDGVVKVFLPKRAASKKFLPNVFELPGGHIDYGEDIQKGLAREIKEELGADVRIGDAFACFTYVNDIKRSHSVEVIFFAQVNDPEAIVLNPADHSESVWLSHDELSRAYTDQKGADDIEFIMLEKGFRLLEGGSPEF